MNVKIPLPPFNKGGKDYHFAGNDCIDMAVCMIDISEFNASALNPIGKSGIICLYKLKTIG